MNNHTTAPTTSTPAVPSFDDFLQQKTSSDGGASAAGHHFIQSYNQDKWGFYLQYVRGLRPIYTKPPLLFGRAVHDAKEAFYLYEADPDAMITTFMAVMKHLQKDYENRTDWQKDMTDGQRMLDVWYKTWTDEDWNTYRVREVEGSHTFALASGLEVSVRWDLLMERIDDGKLVLFDTKTTRYSVPKMYDAVAMQDQATMYLLGLSRVYPAEKHKIIGLVPDIMYARQSVVRAERPGVVMRSPRELLEYEQELIGLHMEMTQKLEALEAGFSLPHLLFPRNGKDNAYFGGDWPNVYRAELPSDPYEAPPGYVVDTRLIDEGPYRNTRLRSPKDVDYNTILSAVGGLT